MPIITLENEALVVGISTKGAELQSVFHKKTALHYLWNGNPLFWAKHSPVLFPIVGTLKDDTYLFNGHSYHLGRHGFARELEFKITAENKTSATLSLCSSPETLSNYPFEFQLNIVYRLNDDALQVEYQVINKGEQEMYFSIGGHPAFTLPLSANSSYTDYYLEFNRKEVLNRWTVTSAGLIDSRSTPFLTDSAVLPLTKDLFYKDAIVLKDLQSDSVQLRSKTSSHGWKFDFPGFPFLGIWAAKDADFICIEPWCGIADAVDTTQQLENKEGMNQLSPAELFSRAWSATFF